ncbi:MAG: aldo/keto reductase [Candidatus Omnitrophica bacterium]|nr:aldo/keto reductase [Candidatus Omnitrophota bacterium]
MQYRKIANSDLDVSAICLGSWVFGGDPCWGEAEDARSERVVAEALAGGINFIDTAPIYGSGRSEEVIGRAIKGKRDSVIIATKCGLEKKGHSIRPNLSAKFIREEIERSLRRLQVERVDLYQCHWPDPNTSVRETFGELNKLVTEGKIKHIGVSNFSREEVEKALRVAPIISNQVQYSLLSRDVEDGLMPYCKENDISILSYGSLGGGILTGKYKEPPPVKRGDVKDFFYRYYTEPYWSKAKEFVAVLRRIADGGNVPVSHVAIDWVTSHPEVASCIVGCRTPEQLKENVNASDWSLSDEELDLIEEGYRRIFVK